MRGGRSAFGSHFGGIHANVADGVIDPIDVDVDGIAIGDLCDHAGLTLGGLRDTISGGDGRQGNGGGKGKRWGVGEGWSERFCGGEGLSWGDHHCGR